MKPVFLFFSIAALTSSALAGVPLERLKLGDRPYLTVTPEPLSVRYTAEVEPVRGYALSGANAALEALATSRIGPIFAGEKEGEGSLLQIVCSLEPTAKGAASASEEGYTLSVTPGQGEVRARITAATPRGLAYGLMSLRQLLIRRDGRAWVRPATLQDAPAVPLRVVKRRSDYWLDQAVAYKLNGGTLTDSVGPEGRLAGKKENLRKAVTDAKARFLGMQAMISMGNIYRGDPAFEERVVESFRELAEWGFATIGVMCDDKMTLLDKAARERWGSYPAAQLDYLRGIETAVHKVAPGLPVSFMPNFYYGRKIGSPEYVEQIRGKLPEEVAFFWGGPGTPGPDLRTDELKNVAASVEAKKLWIYLNWPQVGGPYWADNFGPLREHEVERNGLVDLVSISTSTTPEALPVSFITVCDWLWNPEAYDPERSMRAALKELVDPESYDAFLAFCRFIDRKAPIAATSGYHPMYASDDPVKRRAAIEERTAELEPLIAACLETPAGKVDGPIREQLQKMLGKRDAYLERLAKAEAAEQRTDIPARETACLRVESVGADGWPDEAAWKKAAENTGFTNFTGEQLAPQQTGFRLLRTDDALYIRIRCEEPNPDAPEMVETGEKYPVPLTPGSFLWWAEAVEVFLDPGKDRKDVFHIIMNPWGLVECFSYSNEKYGYYQITDQKRQAWKVEGSVRREPEAMEYVIRLPLAIFQTQPQGEWGFNVGRTRRIKVGNGMKYSTWTPLSWGFQDAKHFGKLRFE